MARDKWQLGQHEEALRQLLKLKSLGLSSLQRTITHNGHTLVVEDLKATVVYEFYDEVLGSSPRRDNTIDLDQLDLRHIDPAGLGDRFTKSEIWNVICSLLPEEASGSDGFMGRFLQVAWPVIRADIMAAFDAFWWLDTRCFHSVSEALMVMFVTPHVSKPHDYVNHMFMRP
jgi:hypothetical protein